MNESYVTVSCLKKTKSIKEEKQNKTLIKTRLTTLSVPFLCLQSFWPKGQSLLPPPLTYKFVWHDSPFQWFYCFYKKLKRSIIYLLDKTHSQTATNTSKLPTIWLDVSDSLMPTPFATNKPKEIASLFLFCFFPLANLLDSFASQ